MRKKSIWDQLPGAEEMMRERWEEKAQTERKERGDKILIQPEKIKQKEYDNKQEILSSEIMIYDEMVSIVSQDEDLKPLLDDLDRHIIEYANACLKLSHARSEQGDSDEIRSSGSKDLERRISHNALISSLSILSRAYVKKYGKNMWRYQIDEGTGDRDRIGHWARAVANHVKNKQ